MSIYPNVTKEDKTDSAKLSKQEENQREFIKKNRISKQTLDKKLAETFISKPKKLSKTTEATEKLKLKHWLFYIQLILKVIHQKM